MGRSLNLVGEKFGYLTVLEFSGALAGNRSNKIWVCRCDCGEIKNVRGDKLKSGETVSCGCMKVAIQRSKVTTHGMKHTKTYTSWRSMKDRCLNPKNEYFKDYGGRGIRVCERWMASFENFLADMGAAPPGKSLDRHPDMNGNYEPGNCRWATPKEQNRNRRSNVMITYNGKTQCISAWAEELGINRGTLQSRLQVLNQPTEIAFRTNNLGPSEAA